MEQHRPNRQLMVFHALHRAHQNAVNGALSARGLRDLGQPMLLVILDCWDRRGYIPQQRELAEALRVSPATVANSLKSLGRMGYVERVPDEKDARSKRVRLTEKGRETVCRCQEVFDQVDEKLFDGFSPAEMDTALRLHERMLENLYAVGGRDPFDDPLADPFITPEERKNAP